MGAAASSSSSSSTSSSSAISPKKYDVFISFRGEDTRNNFTSHLHTALCQSSIETYIDYKLQKGDEISQSLIQAIQDSSISVVVFSENYAFSKWCLDELLQILHCRKYMGQILIPVFYKVLPSQVRRQNGSYEEAFAKHEGDLIFNQEKVKRWRDALLEASNLAGWDSQICRDESELIQNIVNDVLQKLNLRHPSALEGLVGIDDNCECIELLLERVSIVGIWGMGGIGKTTMAKFVFAKLYSQYDSGCFLENVREESEKHGLVYIRDKLLSELKKEKNLYNTTPKDVGFALVLRRLRNKKVLIVLDDVSSSKQLEYLAQECNCLGPNSRVIVTTRDRHLLVGRVDEIYEAKALNYKASSKLFNLKAFHKDRSDIGYEQLSKRAVDYAQGVPLALVVLGSFLRSKTEEEWESALKKLKKSPHEDIQEVLKLSYDGLDHEEREIFLDIACFFKGEDKHHVKTLLDGFGFNASIGLRILADRALITITNIVSMHDLIQKMGWEIVRQESIKEPGRRSRLWDPEEVYNVLENNQGTDAIEGIIFDISQFRDICLSAHAFKKMSNLRFLKIFSTKYGRSCKVNIPSGLESFSNRLTYLHWDNYPLESLPSTFCPEKLVELHMEGSHVKKLWDGVQDFVNLRKINMSGSRKLLELPDFSKAQNLEMVDLSHCENLCNVHPSILSLHTLVTLNLMWCTGLKSLKSESHLQSLRDLTVGYCSSLEEFSLSSKELTDLNLVNTGIERLYSIERFSKLKRLYLRGLTLKNLPIKELSHLKSLEELRLSGYGQVIDKPNLHILFDGLRSLKYLHLDKCSNLSTLPGNISNLSLLCELVLQGSSIESLPVRIKYLPNLKKIDLSYCKMLRFLPELPLCLTHLDARNCVSLETAFTSGIYLNEYEDYSFLFQNCLNFVEHSFNMHSHIQLIRQRGVYCKAFDVCYPGSNIPEWFECEQITETCITIDIAPTYCPLNGFFFCSVLSQLIRKAHGFIRCQCSSEDDNNAISVIKEWNFYLMDPELSSDHVILWYRPFDIWRTTCIRKLTFEFTFVHQDKFLKNDDFGLTQLIKACGVYPIFMSEIPQKQVPQTRLKQDTKPKRRSAFREQRQLRPTKGLEFEIGSKTKRPLHIDEQQQLSPIKKLKESLSDDSDTLQLDLELGLATKSTRSLNID